jgi:Protein of unknown function (DUF3224)
MTNKEIEMITKATGSFSVKMTPLSWSDSSVDHTFGRFELAKEFHGDLEGTSTGQMMSAGSGAAGSSGAYVALEKVTGSLQGRKGEFVFCHRGIMTKGVPELTIIVVPGSGSGELTGLGGEMSIVIADGKHSYEFAFSLATIQ